MWRVYPHFLLISSCRDSIIIFVNKSLYIKGRKYISARRAADITGYAGDYIGQLCRSKRITANLVGRSWYVLESEILDHKNKNLLTHKKTLKTRRLKKNVLAIKQKDQYRKNNGKNLEKEKDENKKEEILISNDNLIPRVPFFLRNEREKLHISGTRDLRATKSLYYKDDRPLFPVLEKKFDVAAVKYVALNNVKEAVNRLPKRSNLEKFIVKTSLAIIILSTMGTLIFERENMGKPSLALLGENVKEELSFLYGSYLNDFQNSYIGFKNNISDINQNSNQLASSVFSVNGWQSVSRWIKDTAYKI